MTSPFGEIMNKGLSDFEFEGLCEQMTKEIEYRKRMKAKGYHILSTTGGGVTWVAPVKRCAICGHFKTTNRTCNHKEQT